ncbi:MAG: hypothetical protein KF734_06930 [Saprospiraceae bacterium]|nr:hypothetical protein [Saprospiraceae bacterium]
MKEPSDLSFIEKTIIEQGDTFVTKENAIEIGRFLFNAHKKGVLQEQHYEGLKNLPLLTKENSLIKSNSGFLANFYEPELRLEGVYKNDFYVSENYFESKDLKSEWKTFFIKIGVNQSIGLQRIKSKRRDNLVEREYFNEVCSEAKQKATSENYHPHLVGEYNDVTFNKITYSELADNYLFSLLFWNEVFKSVIPNKINKDAYLHWGYFGSTWSVKNYFFWSLENSKFIPTTQKSCLKASEVYSNAIPQIFEIAGKYLPVFDYEGAVPPEWQTQLKFIPALGLNEYLQILGSIWRENSQDEQLQKENQKRIGLIYEKLALMNFHSSEREKIKEWANSNKLLAKNGTDFYYPKDLSIVTVEGFRVVSFWG